MLLASTNRRQEASEDEEEEIKKRKKHLQHGDNVCPPFLEGKRRGRGRTDCPGTERESLQNVMLAAGLSAC